MRPAPLALVPLLLTLTYGSVLHAQSQRAEQPADAPVARAVAASPIGRWLEPVVFSAGLLSQNQFDDGGTTTLAQGRVQLQAGGRLRLDSHGRVALYLAGGTGNAFRSGWNHTPLGAQPGNSHLYIRQLSAALKPTAHLELHVGSLGAYRGFGSELTGFDNDAFTTGARVVIKSRRRLWFDEVGITRSFIGDLALPSAFDRLHRLDEPNAWQVVASRRTTRANASIELVDRPGVRSIGGAVHTTRLKYVSAARLEAATAIDGGRATAVAALVERRIGIVTASGGASIVDDRLGTLNGDRFGAGRRAFCGAAWAPQPGLALSAFASRSLGPVHEPRTRLDVLLTYDVLRARRPRH